MWKGSCHHVSGDVELTSLKRAAVGQWRTNGTPHAFCVIRRGAIRCERVGFWRESGISCSPFSATNPSFAPRRMHSDTVTYFRRRRSPQQVARVRYLFLFYACSGPFIPPPFLLVEFQTAVECSWKKRHGLLLRNWVGPSTSGLCLFNARRSRPSS